MWWITSANFQFLNQPIRENSIVYHYCNKPPFMVLCLLYCVITLFTYLMIFLLIVTASACNSTSYKNLFRFWHESYSSLIAKLRILPPFLLSWIGLCKIGIVYFCKCLEELTNEATLCWILPVHVMLFIMDSTIYIEIFFYSFSFGHSFFSYVLNINIFILCKLFILLA